MASEDGQVFIKNLAYFIRSHEKSLANALLLHRPSSSQGQLSGGSSHNGGTTSSIVAAALALPYLNFGSKKVKQAKLSLTSHHLYYLLSRFEELGVPVGPMNVRLENIHGGMAGGNYVSFLGEPKKLRRRRSSDQDSLRSVSSVRSVMTGMSALWSNWNASSADIKAEKQRRLALDDLKYVYSAFTKIPCLRLSPDPRSRLIAGYEEFPFDTAVPLFVFKNLGALEICDIDFRNFAGWDRLADQLRSLTVRRASLEDPLDLLSHIVLDDIEKRRKRSSKSPGSPATPWPSTPGPRPKSGDLSRSLSGPDSPLPLEFRPSSTGSPKQVELVRSGSLGSRAASSSSRNRSISPSRPSLTTTRTGSSHGLSKPVISSTARRSSGSSGSSVHSWTPRNSSSNLHAMGIVPLSKWRLLRHLGLPENGLTHVAASSLLPIADSLQSFDLSSNLFTEIPDSLASLSSLRALNLSNCLIDSLRSLSHSPLPAITVLNLRGNRLSSLAGIERLLSLERIDLRNNRLTDPAELARLTSLPNLTEIYISHNPFTRTHGNYRITIFNLFRRVPGSHDDILIDSTGPSYSEKRHLVDRAPEPIEVPVIKPPVEDDVVDAAPPTVRFRVSEDFDTTRTSVDGDAGLPARSDYAANTQRKRRGPRRRIVELSASDSWYQSPSSDAASNPTTSPDYFTAANTPQPPSQPASQQQQRKIEEANTTPTRKPRRAPPADEDNNASPPPMRKQPTPLVTSLALPYPLTRETTAPAVLQDTDDLYKRKLEALRQDLGKNWLSALSDDISPGEAPQLNGVHHHSPHHSSPKVLSPGIITLGDLS